MKKIILLIIALQLAQFNSYSQIKLKDMKLSYTIKNSGKIINNGIIQGFYMFYTIDKPVDGKINCGIDITDEEANVIRSFEFQASSSLRLIESAYSNNELCFKFLDIKAKALYFKIFNLEGKEISDFEFKMSKDEKASLFNLLISNEEVKKWNHNNQADESVYKNTNLYEIPSGGFFSIINCDVKNNKSFVIVKFNSGSDNIEIYKYESNYQYSEPEFIGFKENTALFKVENNTGPKEKITINTLAINTKSWEKVLEINGGKIGKNTFVPFGIVIDTGSELLKMVGTYYNKDDNIVKDESQGLAMWSINIDGELVSEKYNNWGKDFKGFLDFKENGKSRDIGYVFIHEVFSVSGGRIVAIGEGYKKVFGGTSKYSTSGTSMVITDLAVFNFDSEFNFDSGGVFVKEKLRVDAESDFASSHKLAASLKNKNYFSYKFTQFNEDRSQYIVGFTSIKLKFMSYDLKFEYIRSENENAKPDFIKNKYDWGYFNTLPMQYGKVLVIEAPFLSSKFDTRVVKLK